MTIATTGRPVQIRPLGRASRKSSRLRRKAIHRAATRNKAIRSRITRSKAATHRLRPAIRYPAVLFTTAEGDTRVDPLHARKMAALMQSVAAPDPDRPILLRVEKEAGHGVGKPVHKLVEEETDVWTFLGWQLGVPLD